METEGEGLKEQTLKKCFCKENQGRDKSLKKKKELGGEEAKRKTIRHDQSIKHKLKIGKKRKSVSRKRYMEKICIFPEYVSMIMDIRETEVS